jgi:hypothetical protein
MVIVETIVYITDVLFFLIPIENDYHCLNDQILQDIDVKITDRAEGVDV